MDDIIGGEELDCYEYKGRVMDGYVTGRKEGWVRKYEG